VEQRGRADPHQVLEQRTARLAQTRRNLLGPISLELVTLDIGRHSYRAITSLEALALTRDGFRSSHGTDSALARRQSSSAITAWLSLGTITGRHANGLGGSV
jgi:hypothetical protein